MEAACFFCLVLVDGDPASSSPEALRRDGRAKSVVEVEL